MSGQIHRVVLCTIQYGVSPVVLVSSASYLAFSGGAVRSSQLNMVIPNLIYSNCCSLNTSRLNLNATDIFLNSKVVFMVEIQLFLGSKV